MALSLLGRQVKPTQCATLAATDPNGITTMSGLQDAARSLETSARGMRLTPVEIAMLNRVAILHVAMPNAADHYIVFRSCKGGLFELINASRTRASEYYTAEQLKLMWDGSCLVFTQTPWTDLARVGIRRTGPIFLVCAAVGLGLILARLFHSRVWREREAEAISATRGRLLLGGFAGVTAFACIALTASLITLGVRAAGAHRHGRLLLGANVLELGDIPRGEPIQADVWVANAGKGELHVTEPGIRTSCACAKAKLRESVLSPGAKQPMRIFVGPKAKMGPFRHSIYIPSDDPTGARVLVVKGNIVGPGVAYPPQLYFRLADNDLEKTKKVFFYLGEYPDTRVTGVTCDCPYVKCRLVQEKPGLAQFEAALTSPPATKRFEGTITIATTDPSRAEVSIPFSGLVSASEPQPNLSAG